jgi:hypothetical protein
MLVAGKTAKQRRPARIIVRAAAIRDIANSTDRPREKHPAAIRIVAQPHSHR